MSSFFDNPVNILLVIVVIAALYCLYYMNKDNDNMGKNISDEDPSPESFHPLEQQWQQSKYFSEPLWYSLTNNTYTIIGGDSTDDFAPLHKFRIHIVKDGCVESDLYLQKNVPKIYLETACDRDEYKTHPAYTACGKDVDLVSYDRVVIKTPGGKIAFNRYPNGRIWIGNEDGQGALRTAEIISDKYKENNIKKIDLRSEKNMENNADESSLHPNNAS